MALGDSVDQTKKPKKAPAINQLTANANVGAGGNNTAAAGSNNVFAPGKGLDYNPNVPASPTLGQQFQQGGLKGLLPNNPLTMKGLGEGIQDVQAGAAAILGGRQAGMDVLNKSAPVSAPTLTINPPTAPSAIQLGSNITPSQQSLDAQQNTITPNFGMGGINKDVSQLGVTPSSMSNVNGIKALSAGGGTISSSSPNFGNSTPQRLADLDQTLANDRNLQVIANRSASSQMADQRMVNTNSLNSANLMSKLQTAKANNDIVGFGMYRDLLKEQLGNDTTRAGQNITGQDARLANQQANARLGYDINKEQASQLQTRQLKESDQGIEAQKHNDTVTQNYMNWATDATKGGMAPAATKFSAAAQLGIVPDASTIFGADDARKLSEEKDPSAKMALLSDLFNGDQNAINLWIKSHQSR